jgi:hypothetical protein
MSRFICILGFVVAITAVAQQPESSVPLATPIYRTPVEVETKYGHIIFNGIKLWDFLGSKIIPVFMAEVDNQTGTEWHVPVFQLTFHCPGEASVRNYKAVLGTVKVGRSSAVDWIPGFPRGDDPCNVEAVSMTLVEGDNDLDRSARLEQANRELEAAKLADKQRQGDEERAEAAAEQRRSAARKAAEAKALAKQKAEQRAREAYLAQFPTLENGAEAIFIGSDRKCSEQFVQAMSMDGIEKRKRIADLVSYGCGFVDSRGVHVKRVRNEGAYCQVSPIEGKHQTESGWVPCSWVR